MYAFFAHVRVTRILSRSLRILCTLALGVVTNPVPAVEHVVGIVLLFGIDGHSCVRFPKV